MVKRLFVAAFILCASVCAVAATGSIGTASARGDIRVDNYVVKGNATLFDGSVVETTLATADLRMSKGVSITLATGSRGMLFSDRLLLEQGAGEMTANGGFLFEARGLRVTPSEPNSRGTVVMKPGNAVQVEALTGSFGVSNSEGILLASVRPGHALSFAALQAAGPAEPANVPGTYSGSGKVTKEGDKYFFTSDAGVKYELVGNDLQKYVGKHVHITGSRKALAAELAGAKEAVILTSIKGMVLAGVAGSAGITTTTAVVGGVAAGAAVGVGVGIYEANQNTAPASK